MKTKNLKQKEIAETIGISAQHLNDILRGRKMASKKLAPKLANIYGNDLLQWLYPKRFKNPYISERTN